MDDPEEEWLALQQVEEEMALEAQMEVLRDLEEEEEDAFRASPQRGRCLLFVGDACKVVETQLHVLNQCTLTRPSV